MEIKKLIKAKKKWFISGSVFSLIVVGAFLFYWDSILTNTSMNSFLSNLADEKTQTSAQDASITVAAEMNPVPPPTSKPDFKNIKAKGLYLTGWTVGDMKKVDKFATLANNTEINAYVVDIKDDDGYVGYESNIPKVREVKAWKNKYEVEPVIKTFHENNIYVIGRIVCFKDPVLAKAQPDLAIQNVGGGTWKDKDGRPWLDPYNKEAWPYLIEIAKEGVLKGFDEIQFDYIRFANDGSKKAMNFSRYNGKPKYEAINEFIDYAKKELPDVKISVDVFGIICESPQDTEGIGQYLETVGKNVDYLSPMVYPSHYAYGQVINGVKYVKPDLDPYGVIFNTLTKAKARIAQVPEYKAKMRPYIQDFTASWLGKGNYQTYRAHQVKEQIKAIYDAGYEEWLVWNAGNDYSLDAFQKETPEKKQ